MRFIAVVAIGTSAMLGSGCGSEQPPEGDRHLAGPAPQRVTTPPEDRSPSSSSQARPRRIAESDLIGQYSQSLDWLGGLRDAGLLPNKAMSDMGRTLRLAADGTATVVADAGGDVKSRGTWSIENDTVILDMGECVMRGSIDGDVLTTKVHVQLVNEDATITWTRKAVRPK